MKLIKYLRHTVLFAATFPCAACLDTTSSCKDRLNCPSGDDGTGEGGGSGATGEAGASATGGASGATGGTSGSSGASAGSSGRGGSAGSSGNGGRGGSSGGSGASGTSGAGGDEGAGQGGLGGEGGGETACDGTKTPLEDACVIDEDYGVFVSPAGNDDSGDGSRDNPYATLQKATETAAVSDKRVYACATSGSYDESLSLDDSLSGLELFGGFSCDDWSYSESNRSAVTSAQSLALRIEGVSGLRIEDFGFTAADATEAGSSSLGALVVDSENVVFRRVRFEAGNGADGATGPRQDFGPISQTELDGNSASGDNQEIGGALKLYTCPGGATTVGGEGGDSALLNPSQDGVMGLPDYEGNGGEGGDAEQDCGTGGTGMKGGNAPATPPAPGATSHGELTATGWLPTPGTRGETGRPGQGGGGGRGSATKGGGGGGAGSCGGAGGPEGTGGGASIALAVFESGVTLDSVALIASDAGDGGNGAIGQEPQSEGGVGGVQGAGACQGGNGGLGAAGGAGGGGAGGVSVGLLWSGTTEPVLSDPMVTLGTWGLKGLGAEPGVNDGVDGVAQGVLEAP